MQLSNLFREILIQVHRHQLIFLVIVLHLLQLLFLEVAPLKIQQ